MIPPPLIVQSLKSVSSGSPSSLSYGFDNALSHSSNDSNISIEFSKGMPQNVFNQVLRRRASIPTPTKFGNKTTRGPRVPFERLAEKYRKSLSKFSGLSLSSSPGSQETKAKKKVFI